MKATSTSGVVCEAMESRVLFSSDSSHVHYNFGRIQLDVAKLGVEVQTASQADKTIVADLADSVPTDMPGSSELRRLIDHFNGDLHSTVAAVKRTALDTPEPDGLYQQITIVLDRLGSDFRSVFQAERRDLPAFWQYDGRLGEDLTNLEGDWFQVRQAFDHLQSDAR